jgi:hypothetical protein
MGLQLKQYQPLSNVAKEPYQPLKREGLNLTCCSLTKNRAYQVIHVYVDKDHANVCKDKINTVYNLRQNFLDKPGQ